MKFYRQQCWIFIFESNFTNIIHSWGSNYTPRSTKLKGGILVSPCPSVCPSVCGQNRVRSVSSTILARSISYLHILSSNLRRCITCDFFFFKIEVLKIWSFGKFFKIVTLTLSCFDLGSNMNWSIVWVIMEWRGEWGYPQNAVVLVNNEVSIDSDNGIELTPLPTQWGMT